MVAALVVLVGAGWFVFLRDTSTPVADLRTGDCYEPTAPDDDQLSRTDGRVDRVSCESDGEAMQVLFDLDIVGDTYPGDRAFLTQRCGALGGTAYSPSRESWDDGDRQLTCVSRR